jgi:large subunit ribosomal protein L15
MYVLENNLPSIPHKKQRVGRGNGSNRGKNSGKGHKGQKKRSGGWRVGFEGGQKSFIRRLPKLRGFKVLERGNSDKVALSLVNGMFTDGELVTIAALAEKGIITKFVKTVKVYKNDDKTTLKFDTENGVNLTKGVADVIK